MSRIFPPIQGQTLLSLEVLEEIRWLRENGYAQEARRFDRRLERVEALEREVAMLRWAVQNARWIRHEHEAYVAIPVALSADLSCYPNRLAAIDAAMVAGADTKHTVSEAICGRVEIRGGYVHLVSNVEELGHARAAGNGAQVYVRYMNAADNEVGGQ